MVLRFLVRHPDPTRNGTTCDVVTESRCAHSSASFETLPQVVVLTSDLGYATVAAVKAADDMQMRGFTSVRGLGGPVFGLKRGSDMGLVPGPRIWPSGAFISQTGGHGDFRLPTEQPAPPGSFSFSERIGAAVIADNADAVRQRAREQLALGASQIKLMAEKGMYCSLRPFLVDRPSAYAEGSPNRVKQLEMFSGTDKAYALARKFKIKTAWGTDVLFSAENAAGQGAMLSRMVRWYTPAEALKMATADNANWLALSGARSPYAGTLGVVQEGAPADLLLVDGDPIANIRLLEEPARNFRVIMKDGKIYKNLQQ